ncbi:MAG: hypothetical protein ACOY42_01150 [Pseudomonadota bacterium]
MNDIAIQVEALCKRYGEVRAVDGISFTVRRNSICALLGGDGAGKINHAGHVAGAFTAHLRAHPHLRR